MSKIAIFVNQTSKITPQLVKLSTNPQIKHVYLLNEK
jgi:hypothetical protein